MMFPDLEESLIDIELDEPVWAISRPEEKRIPDYPMWGQYEQESAIDEIDWYYLCRLDGKIIGVNIYGESDRLHLCLCYPDKDGFWYADNHESVIYAYEDLDPEKAVEKCRWMLTALPAALVLGGLS